MDAWQEFHHSLPTCHSVVAAACRRVSETELAVEEFGRSLRNEMALSCGRSQRNENESAHGSGRTLGNGNGTLNCGETVGLGVLSGDYQNAVSSQINIHIHKDVTGMHLMPYLIFGCQNYTHLHSLIHLRLGQSLLF